MSPTFDPAAFLADLDAAGCRVVLSLSGTRFRPSDEGVTYFIAPRDGKGFGAAYCDLMLRWRAAMEACPDHVERTVAHLVAANGWGR